MKNILSLKYLSITKLLKVGKTAVIDFAFSVETPFFL